MNNKINVYLVDEYPLMIRALAETIQQDKRFSVAGLATDGTDAIKKIDAINFDVALMDIALPGKDGIQVMNAIKRKKPSAKILFFSRFPERQYAVRMIRMGASGFLPKTSNASTLLDAIAQVYHGKFKSKFITEKMLVGGPIQGELYDNGLSRLSNKEFIVLNHVGSGMRSKDIAKCLSVSEKTVCTHIANIAKKLYLDTREEVMQFAIRNNLGYSEPS